MLSPKNRQTEPGTPSRRVGVRGSFELWLPGRHPCGAGLTPLPPSGRGWGEPQRRQDRGLEWWGGVHWQERKPLAPSRRFGVPREHVSPNLPSPPPNSGPRAQPGVSRWGGPTPGSVSCRALHSPRGVCAPGGAGRPGALGGSAPRDLAPRHAQATGQPRRALSGGRTQSAERPGSGRRSATK